MEVSMANEKKMDCVILGLLSHESMTGYEIKKRMDTSLRFFWGASYGSIYPTLEGLVNDGMVTKLEKKENGRNKLIYTITQKGHDYLKEWLYLPVEKDELRYETLLKLFFGSEIGSKGTLGHISHFEEKIRNELPLLKEAVQVLGKIQDMQEAHTYYMLTAMFGVKVYEAYIEWCGEAAKILKERGNLDKE
jgi:DNA-binding PadR family transcriptional regulator